MLFFEFDPGMSRAIDGADPNLIWTRLAELGYGPMIVWDNGADPLGATDVEHAGALAHSLEPRRVHLGYHFWDVAVCHCDDTAARGIFQR